MTWHTNPALIRFRSIARKAGLTRLLGRISARRGYEHAFEHALASTLQKGNVICDVGANVGYYTRQFAEKIGSSGFVVAFEPFPATAERLRAHLNGIDNYELRVVALGAETATVCMKAGEDDLSANSRIIDDNVDDVEILMSTGDSVLADADMSVPNVIKIDTEGFELEVLKGMSGLLAEPRLRAIFVKVHFGLLVDRGMPKAPSEIEALLRDAGFNTRWVDSSHIAAVRG